MVVRDDWYLDPQPDVVYPQNWADAPPSVEEPGPDLHLDSPAPEVPQWLRDQLPEPAHRLWTPQYRETPNSNRDAWWTEPEFQTTEWERNPRVDVKLREASWQKRVGSRPEPSPFVTPDPGEWDAYLKKGAGFSESRPSDPTAHMLRGDTVNPFDVGREVGMRAAGAVLPPSWKKDVDVGPLHSSTTELMGGFLDPISMPLGWAGGPLAKIAPAAARPFIQGLTGDLITPALHAIGPLLASTVAIPILKHLPGSMADGLLRVPVSEKFITAPVNIQALREIGALLGGLQQGYRGQVAGAIAGAGAGAFDAGFNTDPNADVGTKLHELGARTAAGAAVGTGLTFTGKGLLKLGEIGFRGAGEKVREVIPQPGTQLTPQLKGFLEGAREAEHVAAGYPAKGAEFPYPGGGARYVLDNLRSAWTDSLAHLQTWDAYLNAQELRQTGRELPDAQRPYQIARLVAGLNGTLDTFIRGQIAPVLATHGIDTEDAVRDFNDFGMLYDAVRRSAKGMGAGPNIRTPEDAQVAMGNFAQQLFAKYGHDTNVINRFVRAHREITDAHNEILKSMERNGLLETGEAQHIIDNHGTYIAWRQIDQAMDQWYQNPNNPLLTRTQGIDYEHDWKGLALADLQTLFKRDRNVLAYIERNRVGRAMKQLADQDPDGFGQFFKHWGEPDARDAAQVSADRLSRKAATLEQAERRARGELKRLQTARDKVVARTGAAIDKETGVANIADQQVYDIAEGRASKVLAPAQKSLSNDILAAEQRHAEALAEAQAARAAATVAKDHAMSIPSGPRTVPKGWGRVPVFENGQEQLYLVPKDFQQLLLGLNGDTANATASILAKVTGSNVFRKGVTVMSLPFILRNIPRDLQGAMVNVGHSPSVLQATLGAFYELLSSPEYSNVLKRTAGWSGAAIGAYTGVDPTNPDDPSFADRAAGAAMWGAGGYAATHALGPMLGKAGVWKALDYLLLGPGGREGRGSMNEMFKTGGKMGIGVDFLDPKRRTMAELLGLKEAPIATSRLVQRDEKRSLPLGGTMTHTISEQAPVEATEQLWERAKRTGKGVAGIITDPFDLIETIAEVGELTTRGAVFRVARTLPDESIQRLSIGAHGMGREINSPIAVPIRGANARRSAVQAVGAQKALPPGPRPYTQGRSAQDAALLARDSTVDFSKAGSAMRAMSMLLPLLNARVQGQLRDWRAAWEDPVGYTTRMVGLVAMPTVVNYLRNRSEFGDMYDKVDQRVKDRNWVFMLGKYNGGFWGQEEKPFYMVVPKPSSLQYVTAPLEQMLDYIYHDQNQGTALAPDQRTERGNGELWAQTALANTLPFPVESRDLLNPAAWVSGIASLNPALGLSQSLQGNYDAFLGQNVVPADQRPLPGRYQVGAREHPAASGVAALIGDGTEALGLGHLEPAAAQVAQAVRVFGTVGEQALNFLDQFAPYVPGFQAATKPRTWEDLRIPPGAPQEGWARYLALADRQDYRPRWAKALSTFFGTAGGQQTLRSKIQHTDPNTYDRWEQTMALDSQNRRINESVQTKIDALFDSDEARRNLTHAQIKGGYFKAEAGRREALTQVANDEHYLKAIKDPKTRDEFKGTLPGVPIGNIGAADTLGLPAGVDVGQVAAEYWNPLPPEQMAALNPQVQDQRRQAKLVEISQRYHVEPDVLMDYIKAQAEGTTVPAMPIPATWFEGAVSRWLAPDDAEIPEALRYRSKTDATPNSPEIIDGSKLKLAREYVIQNLAKEWGLDPADVRQRMELRLKKYQAEISPDQQSFLRGLDLTQEIHDQTKVPRYATADGRPAYGPAGPSVGPSTWDEWDAILARYAGVPAAKRPPGVQSIADAQRYGQIQQLKALWADPRYIDYQRWFGVGQDMTPENWAKYTSGALKKYTVGGPPEWEQIDRRLAYYAKLPASSPSKAALAPTVKLYQSWKVPGWLSPLDYDELSQRRITGELQIVDSLYRNQLQQGVGGP